MFVDKTCEASLATAGFLAQQADQRTGASPGGFLQPRQRDFGLLVLGTSKA